MGCRQRVATLATSEPGCFVRTKEAWPSEGHLLGSRLKLSPGSYGRRWHLAPLSLPRTNPAPFPPASYLTRSPVEVGPERESAGCRPRAWVSCWFPSSSSVAGPLSAQPSGPGRDQEIPYSVEGEAAWKVRVQCGGCCAWRAKHLARGEGGFWKAS